MPPKASLETRKKIYQSLCYVLSDRAGQIAWDEFTPADWKLFSQMAEREGVAPLMYWKLKDSPVAVPLSTFNLLRSTYYQTLGQNTLMYQELERILAALDEAGLPVIVLKGAGLAATLYEDIGLRPMSDLDLLVKEKQFQEALELICSLGYAQEPMPHEFNRQIGYDVHLWCNTGPDLRVELHWGLVTWGNVWFGPEMKWYWEQAHKLRLDVQNVLGRNLDNALALSPECSLLYQSAHLLLQHGSEQARLLWHYDIYQLVSHFRPETDWEDLVMTVQDNKWAPALGTVLAQIKHLFAASVPDRVITALSRRGNIFSENWDMYQRRALRIHTKATDVWESFSFLDLGNRVRYAISITLPSSEYIRWRYHPKPIWLWPLYYPYRWFRMVREVLLIIAKLTSV
jgi:hypothetical protein